MSQPLPNGSINRSIYNDAIYTALPVDLNLPEGYQGYVPDISLSLDGEQYPHVNLNINGYTLQAEYLRNIGFEFPEEELLTWATFLDEDGELTILDTVSQGRDDVYTYELPAVEASYQLFLSWDVLDSSLESPTVGDTFISFLLDGSTDVITTVNNGTCNGGMCEAVSSLQDCSTIGVTDVSGRIGCEFSNLGTRLTSTASFLFIPRSSYLQGQVDQLQSNFAESNNFLFYPISYTAGTITGIGGVEPDCNLQLNNVFGANAGFNVCQLENSVPELWNYARITAQMAIAVLLMLGIYQTYKEMFGVRAT